MMEDTVSLWKQLDPRGKTFFAAAALVLITLVAYSPALWGGFVFDDELYLTNCPLIRAPDGLYRFWFTREFNDFYPLTSTSLWFEWRLWGTNPVGYHLTNILLHVAGSILVWRVLLRLRIPGAWLAALLFAVHPVNVQSVAWVSERKNVLSMLFYLLTILWFLQYDAGQGRRWYFLAVGAFLLALLSKVSVATLPFVLIGCVWWQRNQVRWKDVARVTPFAFLAVTFLVISIIWLRYSESLGKDVHQTKVIVGHVAGAGWAVWFYLFKALLPINLTIVYPFLTFDAFSFLSHLPWILLLAGAAWLCRNRNGWARPYVFGLGYFVISLLLALPNSFPSDMLYAPVADHWQHLAIIGVIALAVGLGAQAWSSAKGAVRRWLPGVAVAIVVVFSVLTWRHCLVFESNETLWADAVAKNPRSWMAHNNLGVALAARGENEAAMAMYRRALEIQPSYPDAHVNLGRALAGQGKFEQAIGHYAEALRMKGDCAQAHVEWGVTLAAQDKHREAVLHYEEALRLKPGLAVAHNDLGLSLVALGEPGRSIPHYETALRIEPDFAEAHNNLGLAFGALHRYDEAIAHYLEAIRLAPFAPGIRNNLGFALSAQGKLNQAIVVYGEALAQDPNNEKAHYNLGMALAARGETEQGIRHLREALRLRPGWPMAANKLAWILATHVDARFRNSSEAVQLATQACKGTNYQQPELLATLAAAFAEANQFTNAVETAQKAVVSAQSAGQRELTSQIEKMLQCYQQGKPYRERS